MEVQTNYRGIVYKYNFYVRAYCRVNQVFATEASDLEYNVGSGKIQLYVDPFTKDEACDTSITYLA